MCTPGALVRCRSRVLLSVFCCPVGRVSTMSFPCSSVCVLLSVICCPVGAVWWCSCSVSWNLDSVLSVPLCLRPGFVGAGRVAGRASCSWVVSELSGRARGGAAGRDFAFTEGRGLATRWSLWLARRRLCLVKKSFTFHAAFVFHVTRCRIRLNALSGVVGLGRRAFRV